MSASILYQPLWHEFVLAGIGFAVGIVIGLLMLRVLP